MGQTHAGPDLMGSLQVENRNLGMEGEDLRPGKKQKMRAFFEKEKDPKGV